jgi:hypothetical protein
MLPSNLLVAMVSIREVHHDGRRGKWSPIFSEKCGRAFVFGHLCSFGGELCRTSLFGKMNLKNALILAVLHNKRVFGQEYGKPGVLVLAC